MNKKTTVNNSRTRSEKFKAQTEYIGADKKKKKNIRADKQKYIEHLLVTEEKAAREGNIKQTYDTTTKLAGKYSKQERPVNDKEDNPFINIKG